MPDKSIHYLERELKEFQRSLNQEEFPTKVEFGGEIHPYELRVITLMPPVYIVIIDELEFYEEKLFKALVLTEELPLGWLSRKTPLLRVRHKKLLLVSLPFWIYLLEDFVKNFSISLGRVSEELGQKLLRYAETTIIPETVQGDYIRLMMRRLSRFNVESLLYFIDKIESSFEQPQIICVPERLSEELSEYAFSYAATSKRVFKGKNWFAYVESKEERAKLTLYLPQEYIGRTATISIKDKVLFSGVLTTDKLVIEGLNPNIGSIPLEEELHVQI